MKLRRFIAILLMTLANIFILVHAVTPHSHHDGIVCFSAQEDLCTTCEDHHSEDTECCETEGQHHSHLEDCDLPQKVERYGDPIDDIKIFSIDFSLLVVCNTLLTDYYDTINIPIHTVLEQYERNIEITNTYNSPCVGSIFGLRAPPASIIS